MLMMFWLDVCRREMTWGVSAGRVGAAARPALFLATTMTRTSTKIPKKRKTDVPPAERSLDLQVNQMRL